MFIMYFMSPTESETQYGPDGRAFYGAVTVGERGQVVIPAQARRDRGIEAGDKLIVLGNSDGIALIGADKLMEVLSASSDLLDTIRKHRNSEDNP